MQLNIVSLLEGWIFLFFFFCCAQSNQAEWGFCQISQKGHLVLLYIQMIFTICMYVCVWIQQANEIRAIKNDKNNNINNKTNTILYISRAFLTKQKNNKTHPTFQKVQLHFSSHCKRTRAYLKIPIFIFLIMLLLKRSTNIQ